MCATIKQLVVSAHDRTVYKVVRRKSGGGYESGVLPAFRTSQKRLPGVTGQGGVKTYRIGKVTQSKAPGLYCYTTLQTARSSVGGSRVIIEVLIPKGSQCYTATMQRVLAEKVIPIREVS